MGSTVLLNEIPYYIPATSVTVLQLDSQAVNMVTAVAGYIPLTVIDTSSLTFNAGDLHETITEYTTTDDVFQEGFIQSKLVSPFVDFRCNPDWFIGMSM